METVIKKSKSRKKRIFVIILAFAIIYLAGAEFVLQTSLNPSFMSKLDVFSSFTEKGYAEQVQSEDIDAQAEISADETSSWLSSLLDSTGGEQWVKYQTKAYDGVNLIASVFVHNGESFAKLSREESSENDSRKITAELKSTAPWVMILHGYTGWKEEMYSYAFRFYQEGYNVIVPDMRAQGESEGKYIGLGWEDRIDNLKWLSLIAGNYPDSDIVIFGLSMGGAASLILSAEEELPARVKCLIADSSFTDAKSLFKNKVRDWVGLPSFGLIDTAGLLFRLQGGYDIGMASALKAVTASRVPVLFIGGEADKTIPIGNLYTLYDACVCEKEKLVIEGAGHGQCADKEPELYYQTIFDFINKNR